MCKLKNYNIYLNKLECYANLCQVRVSFSDLPEDEGQYDKRSIQIDENLSDAATIATFLHELGHFIDEKTREKEEMKRIDAAYILYNAEKPITLTQKMRILDCEKTAWKLGGILAKQLKIPLGAWWKAERHDALRYYYNIKIKKY